MTLRSTALRPPPRLDHARPLGDARVAPDRVPALRRQHGRHARETVERAHGTHVSEMDHEVDPVQRLEHRLRQVAPIRPRAVRVGHETDPPCLDAVTRNRGGAHDGILPLS